MTLVLSRARSMAARVAALGLLGGCAPSFVVGDNYVPSVQTCVRIDEPGDRQYCQRCFAENGVYRYVNETLMTSSSWSCEHFFAFAPECRMLADPAVSGECQACVGRRWYYRSNDRTCEKPSL